MKTLSRQLLIIGAIVGGSWASLAQHLEVDGSIRVGEMTLDSTAAGTIRWNPESNDFEGFTGYDWKSLTRTENLWGVLQSSQNYKIGSIPQFQGDSLGYSMAAFDSILVVGAPGFNDHTGAVFVYHLLENNWIQIARLSAFDATTGDQFGYDVGIYGDVIAVGAPYDDDGGSSTGSIYVYQKPIPSWTDMFQTAKLSASDRSAGDHLGFSVAIDMNVIVGGAPAESSPLGAVYLFEKPMSGWVNTVEDAKLTPKEESYFVSSMGYSVDISNDVVVAGSPWSNGARGVVYVFEKPEGGWSDTTLSPSLGDGGSVSLRETIFKTNNHSSKFSSEQPSLAPFFVGEERFGKSLSIQGQTLVVGAPGGGAINPGAIYVFTQDSSAWTLQAVLSSSDGQRGALFGNKVHLNDNLIVAGAPQNDFQGLNSGAAYVYRKPPGGWTDMAETTKIVAGNGLAGDQFGSSIVSSSSSIIVTSYLTSNYGGSLYIYHR